MKFLCVRLILFVEKKKRRRRRRRGGGGGGVGGSVFSREVLKFVKMSSDFSREVLKFVKLGSQKCWVYDNAGAQVLCFARVIF